ncbi:MAG: hypothetical protein LBJ38_02745 [Oscillospiraceae bacterium]|nr:hypothetical protein [Oscillospiraceae bacterium]
MGISKERVGAAINVNQCNLETLERNVSGLMTNAFHCALAGVAGGKYGPCVPVDVRDHRPGPLQNTHDPRHYAINDQDGFFCVEDANGGKLYTRLGDFGSLPQKDGSVVLGFRPGAGRPTELFVLGKDGSRIKIDQENPDVVLEPGVFVPTLRDQMIPLGGGLFGVAGPVTALDSPTIVQGHLERSNVDSTREMIGISRRLAGLELLFRVVGALGGTEKKAIDVVGS